MYKFPQLKIKKKGFRYLPEIRRYYGGRGGGALVISYIDSVLTLSEKVSSATERKLFSWATVGRKSRNSGTEKKKDFSSYFSWLLDEKKNRFTGCVSPNGVAQRGGEEEVELFMFFFSLVTIPTDGSSHVLLQRGPIALRYFSFFFFTKVRCCWGFFFSTVILHGEILKKENLGYTRKINWISVDLAEFPMTEVSIRPSDD